MRVITKCVWEWQGDELVKVEEYSYEYEGPVAHAKGGGGNDNYYENLNQLYGFQVEQGKELMGVFRDTVLPGYKSWGNQAKDLGSIANQETAGRRAETGTLAQFAGAKERLLNDLGSFGSVTSAESPSFQNTAITNKMRGIDVTGAAAAASAGTGARESARREGLAAMQDWVSTGMGTPTQSIAALGQAGNTGNWLMQNQMWNQQNQQNNIASLARMGVNIVSDHGYGRQGGLIKRGGYVQRQNFQSGGMIPRIAPPMPPVGGGMRRPSPMQVGANAVGAAGGTRGLQGFGQGVAKLTEQAGNLVGSPKTAAFGRGLQIGPEQSMQAADAYNQAAARMVADQMPSAVPEASSNVAYMNPTNLTAAQYGTLPGSEQTALLMAQDAAMGLPSEAIVANSVAPTAEVLAGAGAGLEGAAAIGGAMAPVAAALPVIGLGLAGYGVGSALGWWRDGGQVTPGSNGRTGAVNGPGGPKDDMVPANLSDGEFVMPRGTVLKYGLSKLEKMRQDGLAYEQQMGIA